MKIRQTTIRPRIGFTLVELLIAMSVIGILVGMLAYGVQRALVRAREFAIQSEMQLMQSGIEKFKIDHGFFPPSFANLDFDRFRNYVNRIAPNNVESVADANGDIPMETWWNEVGAAIRNTPGSDLMFWLSGLAKNKQRPLTVLNANGEARPIAAHGYVDGGDGIERQNYFDFDRSRVEVDATLGIAAYQQPPGKGIYYLYRDAGLSYIPQTTSEYEYDDPMNPTGAYVNTTWTDLSGTQKQTEIQDLRDAAYHLDPSRFEGDQSSGLTPLQSQMIFKRIFPNPDSFQLISFGLDGAPGLPDEMSNPNLIGKATPLGADNMVNFGANGVGRLENIILNEN